jgi:prepilin-type N-terminal cleavage/methylation domain-containing protein
MNLGFAGCRVRRYADVVNGRSLGFSLIEMCVVVAIILIMVAASIPQISSTIAYYDLQAGTAAVSGAVQSTRYQAISLGYPFHLAVSQANHNYQVSGCSKIEYDPSNPGACTGNYVNVGSAVPIGSPSAALSGDMTLEFSPSGKVTVITGTNPIVLTRNGKTKTITVSNYGNVKVQ